MRMPKKTRKEKIQSQQRKQIKKITPVSTAPQQKQITHEELKISKNPPLENLSNEEINIRKFFVSDLRKSLLIIGAIFALEFFLYFATMNNYLLRYLNF